MYLIYGISILLNVSSERAGVGAGVLLRAIEPLDGVELMESTARGAVGVILEGVPED